MTARRFLTTAGGVSTMRVRGDDSWSCRRRELTPTRLTVTRELGSGGGVGLPSGSVLVCLGMIMVERGWE